MCLSVYLKEFLYGRIKLVAIILARFLCHTDTAVGMERSLKGLVGLESDDLFLILIKIACGVAGYGGNNLGVHIENAALLSLLSSEIHNLIPKSESVLCRRLKEAIVTVIGCIVMLNKASYVNFFFPCAALKAVPCDNFL